LEEIRDVGSVVAQSIHEYFHRSENQDLIQRLLASGVVIETMKTAKSKRFDGKTFVLTGSLSSMTRDEAKERIRMAGGVMSESVSKNTDYLVLGENPGSKAEKAKKLRVRMLSERDFLKLL